MITTSIDYESPALTAELRARTEAILRRATHTTSLFRQPLLCSFELQPGQPFITYCFFSVPADAALQCYLSKSFILARIFGSGPAIGFGYATSLDKIPPARHPAGDGI